MGPAAGGNAEASINLQGAAIDDYIAKASIFAEIHSRARVHLDETAIDIQIALRSIPNNEEIALNRKGGPGSNVDNGMTAAAKS